MRRARLIVLASVITAACSGSSGAGSTSAATTSATAGGSGGPTGTSGGTTATTATSGATSGTAGTSGGSATLDGTASFAPQSGFYTFGLFADGGLNIAEVDGVIADRAVTCDDLRRAEDAGAVLAAGAQIVQFGVFARAAIPAGTFRVREYFGASGGTDGGRAGVVSVLLYPDGGNSLDERYGQYGDGGFGLSVYQGYDAFSGDMTFDVAADGLSTLSGQFSSQMPLRDGGSASLNGTFNLPFCAP
jgi:hypothetical protein